VRVHFYATLRPIVGEKTVDIPLPEGATVGDLLDAILRRWPALRELLLDERGHLSRHVHIFVDGRSHAHLPEALATPLTGAEQLDIFPAVAGGHARHRIPSPSPDPGASAPAPRP